jgi:hypothetical protein
MNLTSRFACILLMLGLCSLPAMIANAQQTEYTVKARVYLNGILQDVVYNPNANNDYLTVSGNSTGAGGREVIRDPTSGTLTDIYLEVEAWVGDGLLFNIQPDDYTSGAMVARWEVDPVAGVDYWQQGGTTLTYDLDMQARIDIYLTSTPLETPSRDPVSPRWNPDAGLRSGGDLTWGAAWLAGKSQVSDVGAEGYPALLYSGEAFEKQVDLAVKGRGMDFVFSRVHRSGEPNGGAYFGNQWTHDFDIVAQYNGSGTTDSVTVTLGNGRSENFLFNYYQVGVPEVGGGTRYFYCDGWDAELRHVFDDVAPVSELPGHFELNFGDGVIWTFPDWNSDGNQTQALEPIPKPVLEASKHN